MKQPKEVYISTDVESSGSIPGPYSMLSLGACDVDNPSLTFYRELKPIMAAYEVDALKVAVRGLESLKDLLDLSEYNPDDPLFNPAKVMNHLTQYGQDQRQAMLEFADWVEDVAQERKPVFVAFNATYDWSFVNWYFKNFVGKNPFGISGLDIKAYYMGKFNTTWLDTVKRRMPKDFFPLGGHTHNALEDAVEQAEIYKRIRDASPTRFITRGETRKEDHKSF